jgi:hypothetical protein
MPATREYLQGLYDDALCYLCDINSQVELRLKVSQNTVLYDREEVERWLAARTTTQH